MVRWVGESPPKKIEVTFVLPEGVSTQELTRRWKRLAIILSLVGSIVGAIIPLVSARFLDGQEGESATPYESTNYAFTWTLTDGENDSLLATFTIVFDRTNVTSRPIIGWNGTYIEPYLWTDGMTVNRVVSADDINGLYDENAQEISVNEGAYFMEADTVRGQNVYLQPNQTKWFLIEFSALVPRTYTDFSYGRTILDPSSQMVFTIRDETKDGSLTLLLVGPGQQSNLFQTNFGTERDEVSLTFSGASEYEVRCSAYWYPTEQVTQERVDSLDARYQPRD